MPIETLRINKVYRIKLNQRHINAGVCHNRRQCMDAQAVNEAFNLGGLGYIAVEDFNLLHQTWSALHIHSSAPRDAGVKTNWHPRFLPRHVILGDDEQ